MIWAVNILFIDMWYTFLHIQIYIRRSLSRRGKSDSTLYKQLTVHENNNKTIK